MTYEFGFRNISVVLTHNDRWQWQAYFELKRAIVLHRLNVELPLTKIYRHVSF
ncbi:MAG TPA: hypothetical protein V6C57_11245 [Coleofasciculaceae cyanobacterium]